MTNKQKWLMGCGGCLVVLVLLAIVIGIGLMLGINQFKQGSDETTQAIFGDNPPAGYTTIGIPKGLLQDKAQIVFMLNPNTQNLVFVFAIPTSKQPIFNTSSPQAMEKSLNQFLEENVDEATQQSSGINLQDLQIEKVQNTKLPNGKTFPTAYVRIHDQNKNTYTPCVFGLLQEESQVVAILASNPATTSEVSETDFSMDYETLTAELKNIIMSTTLESRLITK